jgi:hypothetical protein
VVAAACYSPPTSLGAQPALEVVLRLPGAQFKPWTIAASPNGALFLATHAGLYRAGPDSLGHWTQLIADPVVTRAIVAPIDSMAFVANPVSGQIHRWAPTDGWHRMQTPVSDSIVVDHDWIHAVPMHALWARGGTDVYAAGWDGTVLRFDGMEWQVDPTPLMTAPGTDRTPGYSRGRIYAIAGDDASLFFTNGLDVYRRTQSAGWDRIAGPSQAARPHCGLHAAALSRGELWVAGGEVPCLFRRDANGRWTDLSAQLGVFSQPGVFWGATQSDGSILFWASAYGEGDVAIVDDGRVRVFQFPQLRWFAGATVAKGQLYVTGMLGDTTVVARVSHRD